MPAATDTLGMGHASAPWLREIIAGLPAAILGVTAHGRIEFANASAQRLFGWASADLAGQPADLVVPAHSSLDAGRWSSDPRDSPTRSLGDGRSITARRRDGTLFAADITVSTIGADSVAPLILFAVREVSACIEVEHDRQRQALEDRHDQAHRLETLGHLAGGVAHDFNNLLGVILNYNSLLLRRVTDPAAVTHLMLIQAASEHAAALTRQLLSFARQDMADAEALEVNDVVRNVAAMLEPTLGELITLRLELTPEPLVAIADRLQLEQIVLNLVINARDAMPDGGRLTIATGQEQESHTPTNVVLSISDTGHGMTPEVARRALEPFFTTRPSGKGTGLGLATVDRIVRQLGGDLQIDSAPDAGTTVTVALRGGDAVTSVLEQRPEPRHGSGERILVVEDEPSLRVAIAVLLKESGYRVVEAGDGLEAIRRYRADPDAVDLVLTDLGMPRMCGDALALLIAAELDPAPVLIMSGYDYGEHLVDNLLVKPVPADVLLSAIRNVLDA